MALRAIVQPDVLKAAVNRSSVPQLYRSMIRELPRVMVIYDVDMPVKLARERVAYHFRKHGSLKDGRVIGLLLAKGYMELEETLMQWKQKTHLMRLLEPTELMRPVSRKMTLHEKVVLGIDAEDDEELEEEEEEEHLHAGLAR